MWRVSWGLLCPRPRPWRRQRRTGREVKGHMVAPGGDLFSRSWSAYHYAQIGLRGENRDLSQMPPATFFPCLDLSWAPLREKRSFPSAPARSSFLQQLQASLCCSLWVLSQQGAPKDWASEKLPTLPVYPSAQRAWSRGSQHQAQEAVLSHSQPPQGSLRAQSSPRGLPIPGLLGLISLAWNLLEQGPHPWAAAPDPQVGIWASAPQPEQFCPWHSLC